MSDPPAPAGDELLARAESIIDEARTEVARAANTAKGRGVLVDRGRDIVEVEQTGETRAGYGDALIKQLAARLTARFGAGFGAHTLRRMHQYYLTFPNGSNLSRSEDRGIPADTPPASAIGTIRTAPLSEFGPENAARFPWALSLDALPDAHEDRPGIGTRLPRDRGHPRRVVDPETQATDRLPARAPGQ